MFSLHVKKKEKENSYKLKQEVLLDQCCLQNGVYGEKSWNVFIQNLNFFSTEERMTWISWMI